MSIFLGEPLRARDAVGSAVMGVNPYDVRHVQMAAKRGLGMGDLERIRILWGSIEFVRKCFSREYSDDKLRSYNISRPLTEDDIAGMKIEFEGRDPHEKDPYAR